MRIRGHALTFAVFIGLGIAFTVVWFSLSGSLPFRDPYAVTAQVQSAETLSNNASVRIAGLDVGRVSSVELAGKSALIGLEIDDEHAPLPKDTRAQVRLRTLIGESYVELYPGTSKQELPDGSLIPQSQTRDYVDVDEILDSLRGETQDRARRFIQAMGGAVEDRGRELNEFVEGASGTLEGGASLTRVLARDREQVARLVESFGDVMGEIGDRGDSVRQLARGMRTTFESVASRDDALRASFDELPPTLEQLRETSGTVESVTEGSAPVLNNLAAAVRELDPAVELLRPAAEEGRGIVRELDRAALPLRGTLSRLRELAGPTEKALPQLRRTLCEANPMLAYLAPYAEDLAQHVGRLGYWTNYIEATGHAGRAHVLVGELANVTYDEQASEAMHTLLDSGLFGQLRTSGYNPYPPPGTAGEVTGGVGESMLTSSLTYPRIEAEC